MWQLIFYSREEHFVKDFCNLSSRLSIIFCRSSRKKFRVGTFYQGNRKHSFFCPVSNLAQRAQASENKLFRKCFIIITKLQSIIFLSNELEKTTRNCFPGLKNVFSLNAFKQNIKCRNNNH